MSTEVDQDARKFVNALYRATEGKPSRFATSRGWRSVCLTEEGAALLRPS
jgi:hypothetical protein